MAVSMLGLLFGAIGELRYHPTEKRVRASLGAYPVADTTRAMLVWEPKRVVPTYAVPLDDVRAELRTPTESRPAVTAEAVSMFKGPPVLTPEHSFELHTCPGEALDVAVGSELLPAAAFRLADPDLEGYVLLDFGPFAWMEESDHLVGHPRDPFHRLDVRRSDRTVRVEVGGEVVAESSRASLVFETGLPVRFYLPPDEVRPGVLRPSATRTVCAYKGVASYWSHSAAVDSNAGTADIAWSYEQPLPDAAELTGLVAFFDEQVDIVLDGVRRERPTTPWSKPAPAE